MMPLETQIEDQDDDDTSELAADLAERAVAGTSDPLSALTTLMQAAGTVCLTQLTPPAFALAAYQGAMTLSHEQLTAVLCPELGRQ